MTTTLLILVLLLFAACLLLLYEVVWMHGEARRMQRLAHDNEVTALRRRMRWGGGGSTGRKGTDGGIRGDTAGASPDRPRAVHRRRATAAAETL